MLISKDYNKQYELVLGSKEIIDLPRTPFSNLICDFLNELSKKILQDKLSKKFPDLIAFAFWCRKSNILKYKKNFINKDLYLGLGNVFHITPSNVPMNFAYSLAFGLLSGNSNIIKLPTKEFSQIKIFIKNLKKIINQKKYTELKKVILFIRYSGKDKFTTFLSLNCDARVIWGGDKTIKELKKFQTKERCRDIAFSDRFSLSILNTQIISSLNKIKFNKLIQNFFNDSYFMDQNACSSPHLIIWYGKENIKIQDKFWQSLYLFAKEKYKIENISIIDKETQFFRNAVNLNQASSYRKFGAHVYVVKLNQLPNEIEKFRGRWGYFYEYCTLNLDLFSALINSKFQTLTYYGMLKKHLYDFVLKNRLRGIDRIVPVGQAHEMDLKWDGYDIIKSLSRIIDIK